MTLFNSTAVLEMPIFIEPGTSVSEDARSLEELKEKIHLHNLETISFGWREDLFSKLSSIRRDCSMEGWDGYEAKPVSWPALKAAQEFLSIIPDNIIPPDIVPEPDGQIALEWHTNDDDWLSIGFNGQKISFAGIYSDGKRSYGEERFLNELPKAIADFFSIPSLSKR